MDQNRKPLTTKLSDKLTPEQHKTTGERIKESFTDAVDNVKAFLIPNSEKSVTQQASDSVSGTKTTKH
jgi:putative IMPACT (imprinted ancient) family translation regulator